MYLEDVRYSIVYNSEKLEMMQTQVKYIMTCEP